MLSKGDCLLGLNQIRNQQKRQNGRSGKGKCSVKLERLMLERNSSRRSILLWISPKRESFPKGIGSKLAKNVGASTRSKKIAGGWETSTPRAWKPNRFNFTHLNISSSCGGFFRRSV